MSATEWFQARLRSGEKSGEVSAAKVPVARDGAARGAPRTAAKPSMRSTAERLQATLRKADEALSPRALRRVLSALQAVIDPRVSEVEGGRRAHAIAREYAAATPEERRDYWALMSEHFAADPHKLKSARDQHQAAVGTADEGQAELRLRRALVSPRMRLLQRFAVEPEGMRFLVDLRAELLPFLKSDKRLIALDAELEHLFSTWFDVAFLELRRIDWHSPASLIEKLIRYEAVHDIKSWTDVKNRLDDSDRRCYGFFHPRLPNEPLIFVEVALVDRISDGIMPLLDEGAVPIQPAKATTAIFYSISNTQNGLRGVSFGDSLIKRVVETLQEELPRLKTFATLSPIPGSPGMPPSCCRAWTKSARPSSAASSARCRRPPSGCSPRWRRPPRSMPSRRCASGCCRRRPNTWATRWSTARRPIPWRVFTWAMARAWSASTGPAILRPRG
jgi:malonyl-CoA decarboxylase